MAKKTNKTDHVLNLLSSGKSDVDRNENKEAPPVDLRGKREERLSSHESHNVSVVQTSGEENSVAKAVRTTLEAEMDDYTEKKLAAQQESMEDTEKMGEEIKEEMVEEIKEEAQTETAEAAEPVEESGQDEAENSVMENDSRQKNTQITDSEDRKPEDCGEDSEDFVVINVMETLVRPQVDMFIEQFGYCNCNRCVEDTVALALCHLPSKYVVTSRDAASPLLDFYAKRYAGQIMVEASKACMTVHEHPHHK